MNEKSIGRNTSCDNFTTVYDITAQQWSELKTAKSFTTNRKSIQCIVSGNSIYVYGGVANHNDIIKLDTLTITWTELYPGPAPIGGIQGYSAILLNNLSILYIGGQPGGNVRTLPYPLFDQNTSGNIPPSRYDHSAVFISQFNQILIFYGYSSYSTMSIMALDTLKFEWSIPTIKNAGGPTIGLRRFTSILIGTYVFIAFGALNTNGNNSTNNVFLLDVSQKNNYEWVTSYDPIKSFQSVPTTTIPSATSSASPSNNVTASNLSNNIKIIGIVFGAISGLIILSAVAILIIRRFCHTHSFTLQDDEPSNEVSG
ncbi:4711_t:CDS:2 [Dentiscutata heterogama]|uniref:4711_t:CDS:1 n=1 Tax=Dentiscutata heterogama TaxID=1316150 RepID=A0ACA9LHF5_9GLOM|nr:4711_t:CDS:2 [Dentiscutata heterogama]